MSELGPRQLLTSIERVLCAGTGLHAVLLDSDVSAMKWFSDG